MTKAVKCYSTPKSAITMAIVAIRVAPPLGVDGRQMRAIKVVGGGVCNDEPGIHSVSPSLATRAVQSLPHLQLSDVNVTRIMVMYCATGQVLCSSDYTRYPVVQSPDQNYTFCVRRSAAWHGEALRPCAVADLRCKSTTFDRCTFGVSVRPAVCTRERCDI